MRFKFGQVTFCALVGLVLASSLGAADRALAGGKNDYSAKLDSVQGRVDRTRAARETVSFFVYDTPPEKWAPSPHDRNPHPNQVALDSTEFREIFVRAVVDPHEILKFRYMTFPHHNLPHKFGAESHIESLQASNHLLYNEAGFFILRSAEMLMEDVLVLLMFQEKIAANQNRALINPKNLQALNIAVEVLVMEMIAKMNRTLEFVASNERRSSVQANFLNVLRDVMTARTDVILKKSAKPSELKFLNQARQLINDRFRAVEITLSRPAVSTMTCEGLFISKD